MFAPSPGVALSDWSTEMQPQSTPSVKTCAVCGSSFTKRGAEPTPHFARRQTCSVACGHALTGRSKTTHEAINCAQCGVSFVAFQKEIKIGRRFCSRKCFEDYKRDRRLCRHCGSWFPANDRPGQWFCSDECASHGHTRGQLAECVCPICGTTTTHYKSELGSRAERLCSSKCAGILSIRKSAMREFTAIELETYAALERIGIPFERQCKVGRWRVDAYIAGRQTVVEVNGDFYHANPAIYADRSNLHKIQRNAIERDARCGAWLFANGYRLIVLWESEIEQRGAESLLRELLAKDGP